MKNNQDDSDADNTQEDNTTQSTTTTTTEPHKTNKKNNNNNKHLLSSPSNRRKSLDLLGPSYLTPSSTPRNKIRHGSASGGSGGSGAQSPNVTPRKVRTMSSPGKSLGFVQEPPVRDDGGSRGSSRGSKR